MKMQAGQQQENRLYGAVEFCLLSAPSKPPFIAAWGTGRWEEQLCESWLPRKYKIQPGVMGAHFVFLGILFPEMCRMDAEQYMRNYNTLLCY